MMPLLHVLFTRTLAAERIGYLLTLGCLFAVFSVSAQNVGINTDGSSPDASALLEIKSSNKGLLIPRVSLQSKTDAITISNPATSLLVYNINGNTAQMPDSIGYYYNAGTTAAPIWTKLVVTSDTKGGGWLLTGNAGTADGTHFIGTTDNVPLNFRVNNKNAGRIDTLIYNTSIGYRASDRNSSFGNSAFGYKALQNVSGEENTVVGALSMGRSNLNVGRQNTTVGFLALGNNVSSIGNTAIGTFSLLNLFNGNNNTAIGVSSLSKMTNGNYLVAVGDSALHNQNGGSGYNTAVGSKAMYSNTTGSYNTALGNWALRDNEVGYNNVAIGDEALFKNTNGFRNVAVGTAALYNDTAYRNTAVGDYAAFSNIDGIRNTAIGNDALYYNESGTQNTALGLSAGRGASGIDFTQCTFLGANSYPTVTRTNVTMLGANITNGQCTGDNQVLLGNTAITSIRAQVTGITAYSDARYKTNIQTNVKGLEFVMKLKPVTYNIRPIELHKIWNTPDSLYDQIDFSNAEKANYIGFIAQDVEKAAKESGFDFPGIDVPKNDKEVYSLRYVDFIMPMVKSIQELKNENDALKEELKLLKELKKEVADLKKQVGTGRQ